MYASCVARLWSACALGCLFLASISPLRAAPTNAIPPTLQNLDPKSFCPQAGQFVSKNSLARAIIDAYKIPQEMVDWEDTGTIGTAENTRAVTTYLCQSAHTPQQIAMCQMPGPPPRFGTGPLPTPAALTQEQMVQDVNIALTGAQQSNPDGKGGFSLKLKKITLNIARHTGPATPIDRRRKPLLADPRSELPGEVFSPDYFDISCNTVSAGTPGKGGNNPMPGPNGGTPPVGGSPGTSQTAALDHFRVRANTGDLSIGRDSDSFAGLTPATLATVNDEIAKKNTFDVDLVLGYALPAVQFGPSFTELNSIPFIQYNRDYVDGAAAPANSSNVNNFIAGIQEDLTFPVGANLYADLFVQPEYIWNQIDGSQIEKLHLALQPEPLVPFLGFAAPIGDTGFSASAYIRGIVDLAQVARSTTNPNFVNVNSYTQGGGEFEASLFNKDGTSIFNGFSVPVDYTILRGFSGIYQTVKLYTGGVNYTLPQSKYVTIGFNYTYGQNVDTFQMQKIYKFTLGIKY